jgi:hypothetical protein
LSGTVTPAAGPVPVPRVLVVYPQKQIYPNCRAQVVDRIPVFHCIWNNTTLLRRIDSDYSEFTSTPRFNVSGDVDEFVP